jgi:hypothetical protein
VYRAFLLGFGDVVGEDKKMGRRYPRAVRLLAAAPADGQPADWAKAEAIDGTTEPRPQDGASWGEVPASLDSPRKLDTLKKAFADYLAGVKVQVPTSEKLNMSLDPAETLDAFRARCQVQAWRMFEKKWNDDASMYQEEFNRYRVAVPALLPVTPDTPWDERWKPYLPGSPVRRSPRPSGLTDEQQTALERLEQDWHGVESNHADLCKRYAEDFKNLLLAPKKGDVKVLQLGLAWVPFWVVPGQAEAPAYR